MAGLLPTPIVWLLRLAAIAVAGWQAFVIRTHAIVEYGRVIHEFDPWFNFRATQYLADKGWYEFFHWFDHMSWYPLGRPVGTTIYPGMQITAVAMWRALNALGWEISLNDVCVFIPCVFGVIASMFLGLLTRECSGSTNAGVVATLIMAIIPAHIMRSVGGGYDNESIAVTAMCMTFFFWCRSLRTDSSWGFGVLAGLAYFYMVAAWGGFIFVVNMVGMHAIVLVFMGRYSRKLHRAYTLFYVIGTLGAIQVPVVGWGPLKSLEQLGPFGVFWLIQMMELTEVLRARLNVSREDTMQLRMKVFAGAAVAAGVVVAALAPTGYFGPLSSRVRGLFVQHTRTGNPLVDSVAEHQPAGPDAYYQYLQVMCYLAPIGFVMSMFNRNDSKYFLILYALVAYYFSNRMARLIILIGPIASALGGLCVANAIEYALDQFFGAGEAEDDKDQAPKAAAGATEGKAKGNGKEAPASAGKGKGNKSKAKTLDEATLTERLGLEPVVTLYKSSTGRLMRKALAVVIGLTAIRSARSFYDYSHYLAKNLSHPSIMFKANLQDGSTVMVDDYREAYWWLRDNTPEDSRVMAWWDYGYQIAGVANRTTIADGNTWNHEHIATLGRALTSPEKEAHKIVRHLADYVLVWAGGGGDDLAKAPHMARIGTSVYRDICPGDPTCSNFGFVDRAGTPSPMMAESLLYKLHSHNQRPGVHVDESRFKEVYTSKYGKVRIYQVLSVSKKSKKWAADPKNWICDAPGSWYCSGQYPPALNKLFKKKRAFKQLEDFNTERDEEDEEYQKRYHARMSGQKPV